MQLSITDISVWSFMLLCIIGYLWINQRTPNEHMNQSLSEFVLNAGQVWRMKYQWRRVRHSTKTYRNCSSLHFLIGSLRLMSSPTQIWRKCAQVCVFIYLWQLWMVKDDDVFTKSNLASSVHVGKRSTKGSVFGDTNNIWCLLCLFVKQPCMVISWSPIWGVVAYSPCYDVVPITIDPPSIHFTFYLYL